MASERDAIIERILAQTLKIEPAQRTEFLERACGGDTGLIESIESLLATAAEFPADRDRSPVGAAGLETSQRIGPYRIISELGQGGMGSVFLAERADETYRQRVAIKVVKRGMAHDEVVRRFRHERQILASLDHPNIARLLDGGATEDGLPYFVMEYVEGQPLDEYCKSRKLPITERLEIFRTVCAAVHYAHQNLVIHRDIKPGNIIVTSDGVPKLLDFGIAKILDPASFDLTAMRTATWYRPMTPAYASPEQVRGSQLTTSTDVYSLGVVLYELLTGRRPYELAGNSPRDIEEVVCEIQPQRPSTMVSRFLEQRTAGIPGRSTDRTELEPDSGFPGPGAISPPGKIADAKGDIWRRQLEGDLDTIALMALRKEPQRRYASAEQLAEDIRRHLEGMPVIARPNTFGYLAAKFVGRNRAGVAAAVLVLISLVAGIVATAWQARVAGRERALAERRLADVRKLANSFLFEFHDAIENLPGSTPARALVVKRALEYLDALARESVGDQTLQSELATAYERVGNIQGNPYSANLGDAQGAIASFSKSLAIREILAASGRNDFQSQLDLSLAHEHLGETLEVTGDISGALDHHRRALAIRESLAAQGQGSALARREVARSLGYIGACLAKKGEPDSALESYRKSLAINRELLQTQPDDSQAWRQWAVSLWRIGNLLYRKQDFNATLDHYGQARPVFETLASNEMNAPARRELSQFYGDLAITLGMQGDLNCALEMARKALALRRALSEADPANAQARRDLGIAHMYLAQMLSKTGDAAATAVEMRSSLAVFEPLASGENATAQSLIDLAQCYESFGDMLWNLSVGSGVQGRLRSQRLREARDWYVRGRDAFATLKREGRLDAALLGKPDQLDKAIEDCDREIAR